MEKENNDIFSIVSLRPEVCPLGSHKSFHCEWYVNNSNETCEIKKEKSYLNCPAFSAWFWFKVAAEAGKPVNESELPQETVQRIFGKGKIEGFDSGWEKGHTRGFFEGYKSGVVLMMKAAILELRKFPDEMKEDVKASKEDIKHLLSWIENIYLTYRPDNKKSIFNPDQINQNDSVSKLLEEYDRRINGGKGDRG
jgi:hypothetical protein